MLHGPKQKKESLISPSSNTQRPVAAGMMVALINPYTIHYFLASFNFPHWSNLKVVCLVSEMALFLVITSFLNSPDCTIVFCLLILL